MMTDTPADDEQAASAAPPTPPTGDDDIQQPRGSDAPESVEDVLARLRASESSGTDTPDGGADFGSPEADVIAEAEAVLDDAARRAQLEHLVAERTDDLQRLQAEYANYRKRVERDRTLARQQGAESVVRDLMPILDAIDQASAHEELTGGFKVVAGEFTRLAEKLGLSAFGSVGDDFDPLLHDALMQTPTADVEPGRVAQVIQLGYRMGSVVLRPARVSVAAAPE